MDYKIFSSKQEKILYGYNDFKIDNYIYNNESSFTDPKPLTDIESILKEGEVKSYKKTLAWFKILINKEGQLIKIIPWINFKPLIDKITNNGYPRII